MSAKLPPKLLKLVTDAVCDFFAAAGVSNTKPVADASKRWAAMPQPTYSSSLGFTGMQMRGAMLLFCGTPVLSATSPQRAFSPTLSDADHADWVGEMANQIVGNLKRLVAGYQVEFQLSTPTVVRGTELQIAGKKGDDLAVLWFEVDGQPMTLHFFAELGEGVSFEGEPAKVDQASGGDAMLF